MPRLFSEFGIGRILSFRCPKKSNTMTTKAPLLTVALWLNDILAAMTSIYDKSSITWTENGTMVHLECLFPPDATVTASDWLIPWRMAQFDICEHDCLLLPHRIPCRQALDHSSLHIHGISVGFTEPVPMAAGAIPWVASYCERIFSHLHVHPNASNDNSDQNGNKSHLVVHESAAPLLSPWGLSCYFGVAAEACSLHHHHSSHSSHGGGEVILIRSQSLTWIPTIAPPDAWYAPKGSGRWFRVPCLSKEGLSLPIPFASSPSLHDRDLPCCYDSLRRDCHSLLWICRAVQRQAMWVEPFTHSAEEYHHHHHHLSLPHLVACITSSSPSSSSSSSSAEAASSASFPVRDVLRRLRMKPTPHMGSCAAVSDGLRYGPGIAATCCRVFERSQHVQVAGAYWAADPGHVAGWMYQWLQATQGGPPLVREEEEASAGEKQDDLGVFAGLDSGDDEEEEEKDAEQRDGRSRLEVHGEEEYGQWCLDLDEKFTFTPCNLSAGRLEFQQ